MKKALLLIIVFFSLPVHAGYWQGFFYVIESSKYNESMTPEQLWNSSKVVITCNEPGLRRALCENQTVVVEQSLHINVTKMSNSHIIPPKGEKQPAIYNISKCEIREKNKSGAYELILFHDFINEKNPENMSNGKYICGFTHGVF